jgi:hypothetical protein
MSTDRHYIKVGNPGGFAMTSAEIYALVLLFMPLAAAFVASVVCWRDRHKPGRDHRVKSSDTQLRAP